MSFSFIRRALFFSVGENLIDFFPSGAVKVGALKVNKLSANVEEKGWNGGEPADVAPGPPGQVRVEAPPAGGYEAAWEASAAMRSYAASILKAQNLDPTVPQRPEPKGGSRGSNRRLPRADLTALANLAVAEGGRNDGEWQRRKCSPDDIW